MARRVLYEEAARVGAGFVDPEWERLIDDLSIACEAGSKTHIAFLATAILAKCVDIRLDAFSVKAASGDRAYSARGLCHNVLVPNAPELDINLGVTGKEPLNNQPYFRIDRVSPDIPVRGPIKPIIEKLCTILERLEALTSEADARKALRAFILVRRRYGRRYAPSIRITERKTTEQLVAAIEDFLRQTSEGGRRAQAVVAALMDHFAGRTRVRVGRVNDPSRTVPGDVAVRSIDGTSWERVIEVRDKIVSREDLLVFVNRCSDTGIKEATVVAVAGGQQEIPLVEAQSWALERGVSLTVFRTWRDIVQQCLYWSPMPSLDATQALPSLIYERLVELEVSSNSIAGWLNQIGAAAPLDDAPETE